MELVVDEMADKKQIDRILDCNNFYEILQVPHNATEKEIRSAYNKLALLVHPDKNPDPSAGKAFIALKQAAAVLIDKTQRKKYDNYLLSPMGKCLDQFQLSESTINAILVTGGIVAGALALTSLFTSLWRRRNSRDERIE